jgi:dienelactone hydrolase
MNPLINKNFHIAFFFLFIPMLLFSQQKTGNIVEYFGKEKVEEINEGHVMHVFKKGLALKMQDFTFNSSSFPKDIVFERFLMNSNYKVSSGEIFDIGFLGNELKWEEINVNKTNSFDNPDLRSSYVYLTYQSSSVKTVLFEASGHTRVLINGFPHEGDHYDYGWNLIPIKLKKGTNVFILKVGRFPRIRARLLQPYKPIQFTSRDLTLPDLLIEENKEYFGAIRIVNATGNWIKNYSIKSELSGRNIVSSVPAIPPMSVRKVPFKITLPLKSSVDDKIDVKLLLKNRKSQTIATQMIDLAVKSKHKHHKRTFISAIDGSVQYYSVAPAKDNNLEFPALFLSVHGASVEAVNQANAYQQKDWGHLVAPTNRRPFGFAWEDWGRMDALEVLSHAKEWMKPDPKRIYLTGHSMGGHGTWYLGATYPDQFAAIAPCAGYPDRSLYIESFLKRRLELPQEQLTKFGMTPKVVELLKRKRVPSLVEKMIERAGTPSRTLNLIRNYLHHGVYVLHGEKDNVVPTFLARDMRERLGKFHADFTYYEYPDGTHWYGNHSVDWQPIFDFFKQRTIKDPMDIKKLEFYTASPGVSSKSNFITIHQQEKPFEVSSFNFSKEESFKIDTKNVALIEVDLNQLNDTVKSIQINGTDLGILNKSSVFIEKINDEWAITSKPSLKEKGPHRNGGFKDAFKNNVVFVFGTNGTKAENEWYYNKARFDAETFWYRANGNIELIRDVDFNPEKYPNQNVIIYGNENNNTAWKKILSGSPIQVKNNEVHFGNNILKGSQWGLYFIVPRKDSDIASIGVVTATGTKGMKAVYANHYLVNETSFPDVLLFDNQVLIQGISTVKCAGFFGNDWTVENGDFEWK